MAQINTDIHFLTILSDSYFNEIFQMHPKIENSANPKEFSAFKIYYYLKNIKPNKTPVPDAISGHVLKVFLSFSCIIWHTNKVHCHRTGKCKCFSNSQERQEGRCR